MYRFVVFGFYRLSFFVCAVSQAQGGSVGGWPFPGYVVWEVCLWAASKVESTSPSEVYPAGELQ